MKNVWLLLCAMVIAPAAFADEVPDETAAPADAAAEAPAADAAAPEAAPADTGAEAVPADASAEAAPAEAPAEPAPAEAATEAAPAEATAEAAPAEAAPAEATTEVAPPAESTAEAAPAEAPAAEAAPAEAAPAEATAEAAPAEAAPAEATPTEAAATEEAPAAEAPAEEAAAPAEEASTETASSEETPAEESAEEKTPKHLYVGVNAGRVEVSFSAPDLKTKFGGIDFSGDFYEARAGIRVFDVVGLEVHYGQSGSDKNEAGKIKVDNYYGAYVVPTGTFLDTIEISVPVGWTTMSVSRGTAKHDFERISFGLNLELPLRAFGDGLPDLRIGGGGMVYQAENDARAYGFHAGVRFDFEI
jgi:hypothetical protein